MNAIRTVKPSGPETFDAVIIGAGAAGITCALALHERGLRPLVLEKGEYLGVGTSLSYGLVWSGLNPGFVTAGAAPDSRESVIEYMEFVGAGECNRERMLAFIDEAPHAIDFLRGLGIRMRNAVGIADHYYGMTPSARMEGRCLEFDLISGDELGPWAQRIQPPSGFPFRVLLQEAVAWGGLQSFASWDPSLMAVRESGDIRGLGFGMMSWLVKEAVARGIEIRLNAPVRALERSARSVVGVTLQDGQTILARHGVVIGSGGYESNPELASRYEDFPGLQSMFPSGISGDGLVMATEIGANVTRVHNNLSVFLGFRNPDGAPYGGPVCRLSSIWELSMPHSMVVNEAGMRFCDETFFPAAVPSLRAFDVARRRHPNLPAFLVFGSEFASRHSFAGRPPGAPIPSWVARADTPGELAVALGVDAANLDSSIHEFNQACEQGVDEKFRRGRHKWRLTPNDSASATMGPVRVAPFYGIRLHPTCLASAGLDVDSLARVLHVRGDPIPGLYAIGNAAARTEYGAGYQAGISLGSAITFGYITARHMADQAGRSVRTHDAGQEETRRGNATLMS